MEKILPLLEKHVQWIALGIAGLLLGWTLYAYVVEPPVYLEVKGQRLAPGEVDPRIMDTQVQPLLKKINNAEKFEPPKVEYVSAFKDRIAGKDAVTELALPFARQYIVIPGTTPPPQIDPKDVIVKSLPKLPPLQIDTVRNGRSTVRLPDPKAPAPGNNAKPVALKADKEWVTVFAKLPTKDLADSFAAVFSDPRLVEKKVDDKLKRTSVLYVDLIRQEELGEGKVGKEEPIAGLVITPRRTPPPNGTSNQEVANFLDWVSKHAADILTPAFYQVDYGDKWGKSADMSFVSDEKPKAQTPGDPQAPPSDRTPPRQPPDTTRRPKPKDGATTPKARKAAGSTRGESRDRGDSDGGRDSYLADDRDRPDDGPGRPRQGPTGAMGGPGIFGGREKPPVTPPPGAGAAVSVQPGQSLGPGKTAPGEFMPSTLQQDIEVWAHDDTPEAGKTYRYKMRYSIKNPLYGIGEIAPKELSEQYQIAAPDSPWSDWVTISPRVNFWLAGYSAPKDTARFDVFTWQNGKYQKTEVAAVPGDPIGDTGWTLVEARKDQSHDGAVYVLLVNDQGQILRRDKDADAKDPQYRELNQADSGRPESTGAIAGGR